MQRGESFAINDHSAEGMFVIGKRFQTNVIISITADEKIISWWESVQILVSGLDGNVCNCRTDRYLGIHVAGVCPFVILCSETTLAQEVY